MATMNSPYTLAQSPFLVKPRTPLVRMTLLHTLRTMLATLQTARRGVYILGVCRFGSPTLSTMLTTVISLLLATATSVLGHGYVQEVKTSAGTFTGYLPYSDPYYNPPPNRIIRKIPGNGPVQDVTLIDLQCNGWSEGG
ncbi:Esterase/lipase/thioesterase, partial [Ceratobasidium sp. UAMH 11750]